MIKLKNLLINIFTLQINVRLNIISMHFEPIINSIKFLVGIAVVLLVLYLANLKQTYENY